MRSRCVCTILTSSRSKRDERPDDEPSISGRASTSRVNAAEADLSEIISNVDMSTVDDPMSAFSQNIPSDFQSAFSLESGNREVLAGIGQAPSVHPLDEYALSSNFRDDTGPGFQVILENDLSKLEHASGLGNGETYSTQYVPSGRGDVSAPIDLLNESGFGTGKPPGIEQQPDVPYEQNSLHTVMRGQLSPNEDSVPDADQDAGNKMMCEYCGKTKQRECDLRYVSNLNGGTCMYSHFLPFHAENTSSGTLGPMAAPTQSAASAWAAATTGSDMR